MTCTKSSAADAGPRREPRAGGQRRRQFADLARPQLVGLEVEARAVGVDAPAGGVFLVARLAQRQRRGHRQQRGLFGGADEVGVRTPAPAAAGRRCRTAAPAPCGSRSRLGQVAGVASARSLRPSRRRRRRGRHQPKASGAQQRRRMQRDQHPQAVGALSHWPRSASPPPARPSSERAAVAPSATSACGCTSAISLSSQCRQASASRCAGVLWMRRLPRSSNLKCLTALVT